MAYHGPKIAYNLPCNGHFSTQLLTSTQPTIITLVVTIIFQQGCENQLPLKSIWSDSRLQELSIESKNIPNGARTRKLWSSEVGGLAQTMQLGSCVKPTKLHSQGSFKAPVHAIFPTQTHPGNNPFTRQQTRPNWDHKSAINMS